MRVDAEIFGGVRAHAGQGGETFIGRWRHFGVGIHHGGEHVINLLGDRVRQLRVRDQVGGQPAGHLLSQELLCGHIVIDSPSLLP